MVTPACFALDLLVPDSTDDWIPLWFVPFLVAAILSPVIVGLLIANRQPQNVIAWIMLLGPVGLVVAIPVGIAFGDGWMLQMDRANWPLLYAWPIAVAFVFPNGHLLSPRWRWVVALAVFCFAGFMTLAMLDPSPFYGEDATIPNPLANNAVGETLRVDVVLWVFWLGMLASLFAGAYAIRLRFAGRRGRAAADAVARVGCGARSVVLLLCFLSGLLGYALGITFVDWVVFPLLLGLWIATAAAVGVAVTRHGLYAIERLVNRTLVYVVADCPAASPPTRRSRSGSASSSAATPHGSIAPATLAVALAFRPLRARIQDLVDRRYRRARYEGVRLVRSFEDEVRDGRARPRRSAPSSPKRSATRWPSSSSGCPRPRRTPTRRARS